MKNPKFNVAPAKNAGENEPQWAVWQGNWQIATLLERGCRRMGSRANERRLWVHYRKKNYGNP